LLREARFHAVEESDRIPIPGYSSSSLTGNEIQKRSTATYMTRYIINRTAGRRGRALA
jgi:hypothetical protein